MTQYDPLLPQTSDAFFSSTISILASGSMSAGRAMTVDAGVVLLEP